ncbi:hypothetical protein NDU88_006560 [Pleurodeles waltl]|uniref:C2 domain-containing protein n=1 Tax=Pleurodeles waltl TaxID=8319 RepID=A0AAV7U0T2_PLEWA|nr:hypothetical protein NDU88_006560 [Pleurodeles waltl]
MAARTGATAAAPPMQRTRLKLEEKVLDFEFEVVNVQFNQLGCYMLQLTVENPLLEGSGAGVQLRINDGDMLYTSTGATEAIEQKDLNDIYAYERRRFNFTLPQGFCKNDKNHDVRLKIEVMRLRNASSKNGQKVGEAFFAIYPRTNQPRINLLAGKNEDLYRYGNIMALLRVRNEELAMHCGRLAYTVSFHEHRPPKARPPSALSIQTTPWPNLLNHRGKDGELTDRSTTSKIEVPASHLGPIVTQRQPTPATSCALTPEAKTKQPPAVREESPSPDPLLEARSPEPPQAVCSQQPSPEPVRTPRRRLPSDASFHLSTPGYSPEPDPNIHHHVTEEPSKENVSVSMSARGTVKHTWLVSPPGKEHISITLHGATNLPALADGAVPQPFAIVKSSSDEKKKRTVRGVTHSAALPTHSPNWEETFHLEIEEDDSQDEAVVLNVADSRTKELLVSYRVPVNFLQPFHHYHLELVQVLQTAPAGARLYATVVRQKSLIPHQSAFTYTALEVFLQSFEMPLKKAAGPITAVARIVPNYEAYREHLLHRTPGAGGILPTTVTFPKPSATPFEVPMASSLGQPQVSPAGLPSEQPTWNHSFLFQGRDGITLFSEGAALVLEYYLQAAVTDRSSWYLDRPLGFSLVPLTPPVYQKLQSENGQRGIQVEQLPVQGTYLRNTSDNTPSVSLILRLICSERPDLILTEESTRRLPALEPEIMAHLEKFNEPWVGSSRPNSVPDLPHLLGGEEEPVPRPQDTEEHVLDELRRDGISLPPHDALTAILPDYHLLYHKSPREREQVPGHIQPTGNTQNEDFRLQPLLLETGEHDYLGGYPTEQFQGDVVQHHQDKELENYRSAMQRMADDIIALRKRVASLEAENSQLRSDLSLHQDLGRTLLDDTDIDVMTKAEVADRIVSLKHKLASETQELRKLKDKVQQLQNELIRKNDREKELVLLKRAHQQQQAVLSKYQEKLSKTKVLEDTIKQQEKIIEKMERIMDNKLKEHNRGKKEAPSRKIGGTIEDTMQKEVHATILAENARLRGELDRVRFQPAPIILQQPPMPQDAFTDSEKLSLLAKLEKAQSRVQNLESQLEEAARKWGREKQDLLTKLSEQDHGFARTSTMILHDYPLKNGTDPLLNLRRHQKLNPLT